MVGILEFNSQPTSNTPLKHLCILRAGNHVQIHTGTRRTAAEYRFSKTEFRKRGVYVVSLVWAVRAWGAVDLSTGVLKLVSTVSLYAQPHSPRYQIAIGMNGNTYIGRVHSETPGVSRAIGGTLTLGAVDEREVIIDFVIRNRVFKLGVCATNDLVGVADFKDDTTGAGSAEGLSVSAATSHLDRCGASLCCY